MDGYVELSAEKMLNKEGVNELNRMLNKLFEHSVGDGDTVRVYKGYGVPSIAAGDGSMYQRLDGGKLYVRESGVWQIK